MAIETTTSCQLVQNFIVCAVATFKTLLFVQSRHSKLYCLCSRDIQNFIVCAVETFETLLFVQSRHSKLYCLCSRAIRNFLVCVSLLGLRSLQSIVCERHCATSNFAAGHKHLGLKLIFVTLKSRQRTGLGCSAAASDINNERFKNKIEHAQHYSQCNIDEHLISNSWETANYFPWFCTISKI